MSTPPVLHLYLDWLSQPARACALLLLESGVPHEFHVLHITKGQTKTPEFKALNPAGLVPVLVEDRVDGKFILTESHAILRYICLSRQLEQFYPSDLTVRGRIDSWLDWKHTNLRIGSTWSMMAAIFLPSRGASDDKIERYRKESRTILRNSLTRMNNELSRSAFLAGTKTPSIADLALAMEITSLPMSGESWKGYEHVESWLGRLEGAMKQWNSAHAPLYKVLKRMEQKASKSALTSNPTSGKVNSDWSEKAQKLKSPKVFDEIRKSLASQEGKEAIEKLGAVFKYQLTGEDEGKTRVNIIVDLKTPPGKVVEEDPTQKELIKADVTFTMSDNNFLLLAANQLNAQMAFLSGKLKVQGNMAKALKFNAEVFQKQAPQLKVILTELGLIKTKSKL
jgi:glutathione S-transferase